VRQITRWFGLGSPADCWLRTLGSVQKLVRSWLVARSVAPAGPFGGAMLALPVT
jgi:hypothetical protein